MHLLIFPPPDDTTNIHIPVSEEWFQKIKRGDTIHLDRYKGEKSKIIVDGKKGNGRWGYCFTSAYVSTGTELKLFKPDNTEKLAHRSR